MIRRLPYTWFHRITLLLSVLMVLGMLGFLLLYSSTLPEQLPTHFNASGQPDAWGGRRSVWLIPLISLGMLALMLPVIHFPRSWNVPGIVTERNRVFVYLQTKHFLCTLTLAVTALFGYIFLCTISAMPLHGTFLPVVLAAFLAGPVAWLLVIRWRARRI